MPRIEMSSLKGISADSRQIREGWLFAALPGSKTDGRQFIGDAIQHGAKVILGPPGTALPGGSDIQLVTDENPRRAFALMAAEFYTLQPETIVAITGTNGKTSTASFCQQIWHLSGTRTCASLGTLGVRGPGMIRSGSLTTPDPAALHAELADLSASGITHLAMEASSHGLDQFRLDGVRVNAAGFTNLTRDHLDYHKDMEMYLKAKARLFSDILQDGGTAVLNADDPMVEKIKAVCKGKTVVSYGYKGKDITLKKRTPRPGGQDITLQVEGKEHSLTLPLVGKFQVMNALCALGLVAACGSGAEIYIPYLAQLRGVPGRLQLVSGHPQGAAVYVDYAHTPDALENVLKAVRPHTSGKLYCLMGCGGDRDPGKRPMMGKIATMMADVAIVTDDNPRSEDPAVIRTQVMKGAGKNAKEIADRRAAITWAIKELQKGDVLVVAGKGHEQGQIFADYCEPFDDVTEARKAIEGLNK